MPLRLIETAPPALEPLTLDEAKLHLRVTSTMDDALIIGLVATARQLCEGFTGLALIQRGYSLYLDAWRESSIILPRPPLLAVSLINIYDADDAAEVFDAANYGVSAGGLPGRIHLTDGTTPPQPGRAGDGIEIQYTAGYGPAADDVPVALRQGIKQLVAHLYEQRGDATQDALQRSGASALFQPFRVMSLS